MLGPEGAGFFYIRDEHLSQLRPVGVGWNSVVRSGDFDHIQLDFKPSAARFEGGSENIAGFIALGASLRLLVSYGAAALSARLLEITDLACQRLEQAGASIFSCRDGDHRSGIVAFSWPGDMKLLRHQLLDRGVVVSFRSGRMRISPHAYNNLQDIDRLLEALRHPR
jgi:selenocysteine lyase/cysteine desulfurase